MINKITTARKEILIDIHLKHLKLSVEEKTPVRVVLFRGRWKGKSQVKTLNESLDQVDLNGIFHINTVIKVNKDSMKPVKEKIGKMTVVLDESKGGTAIGEVEFDMSDFDYGKFKYKTLYLTKLPGNDVIDFDS